MAALQGSAGNAAVGLTLGGNSASRPVQRMEAEGSGSSSSQQQAAPQQTASPQAAPPQMEPDEVLAEIGELVDNPPMVSYGARRQGRAHDDFWMRFPRDKVGEEAEQTISETSALLFDSMKGAQERARAGDEDGGADDANNREVQGMLINDRLVFASNFNSSVDTLVEQGEEEFGETPSLTQLLTIEQSNTGRTKGLRHHEAKNLLDGLASARRKNRAIVKGQRGDGEQGRGPDPAAIALRAKLNSPVVVVDIEDENLHTLLTSEEGAGRVFLLRFGALDPKEMTKGKGKGKQTQEKAVHAEQKLLLALHHAKINPRKDIKGPIAIMGKFRPCMGCAAALKYYRERLGFEGLKFDENYGHYFQGSVDQLATHQQHIMDEHYLEYIRQMVADDITSTPAARNEAAPEGAVTRRGGPSVRVPGRYASRQADVTPAASDAEFDSDDEYVRTSQRPLDDMWTLETANTGIGKGAAAHTVPRRRHEYLTEEQGQQLTDLWNGGESGIPTSKGRQQALELADKYNGPHKMTFDYIAPYFRLAPNRLNEYVSRYRKEGHWDHVPSRSNKVPNQPKNRKKGDPAKQFTKGGALDDEGRQLIEAVIRSLGGDPWCEEWIRLRDREAGGEELPETEQLSPTKAPEEILRTLAQLRRDRQYSVPDISRFLYGGKNGDKLRKAIANKGMKALEKHEKSSGPGVVKSEDVEMGEASSSVAGPSSASASAVAGPSTGPSRKRRASSERESGREGTAPPFERERITLPLRLGAPQVPGYELRVGAGGQPYYVDEETGFSYVRVEGRMVRLREEDVDSDAEMSGAGGA